MRYVFADCVLDTQLYTLSRAGTTRLLRPKVFQLLAYLLAHRDHVVSKEELGAQVWPGQFISETTLESCLKRARQAIGDSGHSQQLIQTSRGYGYRFIGAVKEQPETPLQGDATATSASPGASAAASAPQELVAPLWDPAAPAPVMSLPREAPPWLPAVAAADGERKLVTLLGCTLAHASALWMRRGLDALHSQMRTLSTLARQAVHQYGGTLHAVTGERLLAVFGAPLAQEDHARRAVLAACTLHQWLAISRDPAGAPAEVPLAACLGLHTGLLVVGGLGEAQAPAVVGELILAVEALQAHAAPGTLLCSAATADLIQRDVRLAGVAPVPIPGQPTPLRTYQIVGLRPRHDSARQAERRARRPFVGRAAALATLQAVLAQVMEGRGQVVGIVGEPGIGKSRLLAEWRQRLRAQGIVSLEGHCLSYGSATPYLPVLDLLRAHCGITPADGDDAITAKVCGSLQAVGLAPDAGAPALLHLLGGRAAAAHVAGSSPDTLKAHIFAALRQLWLQSSRQHPLILAIEDLHWCDPTSEEFVAALVEGLPGAALLVLGTYRPGYRPVWLEKSYATQLTVPPLSAQDSVQVVQAVLQCETVPPPLAEALLARAQGNPFFLEELAQTLVEQGVVRGGPSRQSPRPQPSLPALQLPPTVQAVLAARIDSLAPEDKRLLQTAAVLGTDVPVPLLYAIAAVPEAVLHQSLAHLQAAEFLYETRLVPECAYTFKHVLTHEVAYGSLLLERRRMLHARIVETLEALVPDRGAEQVERLAHHALGGEVWDKAVAYCRQAGEKALAQSAYREAVGFFEQALMALAQLPEPGDTRRLAIELRLALGRSLGALGEYRRHRALLDEAETLARGLDDRARLGRVLAGMASIRRVTGDPDGALAAAQQAHALATALGERALQAYAAFRLGQAYWALGDFSRAAELLERSVEAADREAGPPSTALRISSRAWLARTLSALGAFAEGRHHGEEALRLATLEGRRATPLNVHGCLGLLYLAQGDLEPAIRVFDQGLALCRASGHQDFVRMIVVGLGYAAALQGRLAEGRTLLEEGIRESLRRGARQRPLWGAWLSEVCRLAGHGEEAWQHARQALDLARQQQARGEEVVALYQLGTVHAHATLPDVVQAEAYYRQALALAEALGMRPRVAHCHRGLGMLYAHTGQWEQARAELSTAIALYRAMEMTFWLPQTEAAMVEVETW